MIAEQERAPKFGGDISDIPLVTKAAAYSCWFGLTGWVPQAGNLAELKEFCAGVFWALEVDERTSDFEREVYLAIGAGISQGIKDVCGQNYFADWSVDQEVAD